MKLICYFRVGYCLIYSDATASMLMNSIALPLICQGNRFHAKVPLRFFSFGKWQNRSACAQAIYWFMVTFIRLKILWNAFFAFSLLSQIIRKCICKILFGAQLHMQKMVQGHSFQVLKELVFAKFKWPAIKRWRKMELDPILVPKSWHFFSEMHNKLCPSRIFKGLELFKITRRTFACEQELCRHKVIVHYLFEYTFLRAGDLRRCVRFVGDWIFGN